MCFSLAAFNPAGLPVRIEDPKCVAKTFPDYFEALFSVVQTPRPRRIPVICVDGPTASGKGTLAAGWPSAWATTSWIPAPVPHHRAGRAPGGLALDAGHERPLPPWPPACRAFRARPHLLAAKTSATPSAPKKPA
jgi:hypothetical protein